MKCPDTDGLSYYVHVYNTMDIVLLLRTRVTITLWSYNFYLGILREGEKDTQYWFVYELKCHH